jgi:hypothetical protein
VITCGYLIPVLLRTYCNSQQDLKSKRRLERNKVTMRVGNGQRVDVVAVGTLHPRLPSRFILVLNKFY